jgi:hypothetical protein
LTRAWDYPESGHGLGIPIGAVINRTEKKLVFNGYDVSEERTKVKLIEVK